MKKKIFTYGSLFSGAGIGCYGFNQAGFSCIGTVEILEKRIKIQKYNKVCDFENGYICGDLSNEETLKKTVQVFKKNLRFLDQEVLDVLIATPPCQGMSVANHKKKNELPRNSLVIESIKLVNKFKPNFFVFENVASFLNTQCMDIDGKNKKIQDAILNNLSSNYHITAKKINFGFYGAKSSRTRTLVIGVSKKIKDIYPTSLFPSEEISKTLRQTISHLPTLEWGEICKTDLLHSFKEYKHEMIEWIHDLKEGQSAFDNKSKFKRPHQIVDGKIVENKNGNGDKYKRQVWDKLAPCVHTRNDILASQNTIHPQEDRVFSIRELMEMMTIPKDFNFFSHPINKLNQLPDLEKKQILKKEEINIRQSIGEAVPTIIFYKIAKNYIDLYGQKQISIQKKFSNFITETKIKSLKDLANFIDSKDQINYSIEDLQIFSELLNNSKHDDCAFYTEKSLVDDLIERLPLLENKNKIRVLEPSVGCGNFIFPLIKKYYDKKTITIDCFDINKDTLNVLNSLIKKFKYSSKIKINLINSDFLKEKIESRYDIAIGNPPFKKLKSSDNNYDYYKAFAKNKQTNNLFVFFLEKIIDISDHVAFIVPKSILGAPEFNKTREQLSYFDFNSILDFGEKGFKGVLIETIGLSFETQPRSIKNKVLIKSYLMQKEFQISQQQMMLDCYPTWLLYRDKFFDKVSKKLSFGCFDVFRDRQITNKKLKKKGKYPVIKSANIGNNKIVTTDNDLFIDEIESLTCAKYLSRNNLLLVPNLSYMPRAARKPRNSIVDGSAAILIPKNPSQKISNRQIEYFASDEFQKFYKICRNFSTRSMNIDSNYVFYFGLHHV